jgi:hypothetical protein
LLRQHAPHQRDRLSPKGSLPLGSQGTATLFLDGVCITINVHLFGGDPQANARQYRHGVLRCDVAVALGCAAMGAQRVPPDGADGADLAPRRRVRRAGRPWAPCKASTRSASGPATRIACSTRRNRQTAALQRWKAELDAKVEERTRALEDAQAQLLRAERLAAMGQLTASIAHGVNTRSR